MPHQQCEVALVGVPDKVKGIANDRDAAKGCVDGESSFVLEGALRRASTRGVSLSASHRS